MLSLVCLFCVVCVSLAAPASFSFNSELDSSWQSYKHAFNKNYENIQEATRRAVWESNVGHVHQHNLEADMGKHTYTLGVNEYSDMTSVEFVRQMNGYRSNMTSRRGSRFLPAWDVQVPGSMDWREHGYVTPVKNQGQCGSCWSFSTTGSLEGQHFKKTNTLVSLSEQQLVDCAKPYGPNGCKGGWMDDAFWYVKENHGIDTESAYHYEAKDGKCRFKPTSVGATDTGYVDIASGDEHELLQAAASIGPISVAIDASHASFQQYRSGVYKEPLCKPNKLDHAVLVVGYGTLDGVDYWLVKNSWGSSWGMSGYIMMARNYNNHCGIASAASYPLV